MTLNLDFVGPVIKVLTNSQPDHISMSSEGFCDFFKNYNCVECFFRYPGDTFIQVITPNLDFAGSVIKSLTYSSVRSYLNIQ